MDKNTTVSTTYYSCPECCHEQIVYLVPNVIEDKGSYKFTTSCSNCESDLSVKIGFSVNVAFLKAEEE